MRRELEDRLFTRFTSMFPGGRQVDPKASLLCFGCMCGDGWFTLIWKLCEDLEEMLKRHPEPAQFQVLEVKEKWGGLRFYVTGTTQEMWDRITQAEDVDSYNTCEACGAPGKPRTERSWVLTLCDKCDKKKRPFEEE